MKAKKCQECIWLRIEGRGDDMKFKCYLWDSELKDTYLRREDIGKSNNCSDCEIVD